MIDFAHFLQSIVIIFC